MRSEKVTFKNSEGLELSGQIDFPIVGKPRAFAIFAHCFTCSKNLKAVEHICTALTQNNLAVLRFDFTGLGKSNSDFSDTNFSSNLEDLRAANRFLNESYESPQIMIGHSLGGAAVLQVSGELDAVRAVVTIGAPADPTHLKKLLKSDPKETDEKGETEVTIGGRLSRSKNNFWKICKLSKKTEQLKS